MNRFVKWALLIPWIPLILLAVGIGAALIGFFQTVKEFWVDGIVHEFRHDFPLPK